MAQNPEGMGAAAEVEEVLRTPAPEVYFRDYQDSALLFELRVWIDNYASLHAVESDLRKQIWYAFKRYGITIPFPQRDVNLRRPAAEPRCVSRRLVVTAGPLRGAMFPLGDRPVTLGRNADCEIVVSDPHVSGRHAVFELRDEGYYLRDLGSRHCTHLNGHAVREARLEQGDEIRIGPVTLVFELHAAPAVLASGTRCRPAEPEEPASPERASTA